MRHLLAAPFFGALLLFVFLLPAPADAGWGWGGTDIDYGLRPGVNIPSNGIPLMERYNYGIGAQLFYGQDVGNFYYMDYLDRADRAAKFGYRMPPDPFYSSYDPARARPHSGGGVFGFGILRRR